MNEYLLRHAVDTIWCNPAQDRQYVYKLAKLTPRYGAHSTWEIGYERYVLPTPKEYYHVYQIGQVTPTLLGLPKRFNEWISLADLANEEYTLMDLHTPSGIQFPRFESYIMLTKSRNLVFAVRLNDRITQIEDTDLYARFYSNAYFDSKRSDTAVRRWVKVMGKRPVTTTDLVQFQVQISDFLAANPGRVPIFYVNGRFVNELTLVTCAPGDAMEMVVDSSINRFIDFPLRNLPTFLSTLDNENKYLIHYNDPTVQRIEYFDDLDAFLYKPSATAGRFLGVTYHRNEGTWFRQLTHKDYSAPVERMNGFVRTHEIDPRSALDSAKFEKDQWQSLSELTLRIYFRESGYNRPLQPDVNRIQQLYRLSDTRIVQAMTGVNSTNPLWKAANLEASPYVKFMAMPPSFVRPIGSNDPDVDTESKTAAQELAGDVFGYHAAASILAATPSKPYLDQGQLVANMAYTYWFDATVYEYDAAGVLLGSYYHVGGRQYKVRNTSCALVEAITGKGGDTLNTVYGTTTVDLNRDYNFRVYVSTMWAGVPQGDWKDVTEDPNLAQYGYLDDTTENWRWVWTADPTKVYGAVRQDNYFLSYELTFKKSDGVIRFSVENYEVHGGDKQDNVLEIPFGQLDLYLNGRPLIENLDYVVNWPEVVVCNLEYLTAQDTQRLLVRGFGFCKSDFTRPAISEFGFIEYGVLSNNKIYDVHTHKVQRLVVDGHYRNPKDMVFEEDRNSLTIANERNGAPYTLQTPPIVFKDVYHVDANARKQDDIRDKAVSDYMTLYFPQRTRTVIDTITTQYHVISVFANKVLRDLLEGTLNPPGILGRYTEMDIRKWLASYEWLLPFDLCNREYNENHVQVWPHWYGTPQGLPIEKYDFYQRILKTYLRQVPDISVFVYVQR